jgi:hypothetical protein
MDVVNNRIDLVDGIVDNIVINKYLWQVVRARSTPTVLVGFTDLSYGLPATRTIRLVETITANTYAGRQLEIGSVKAVFAHLFKVLGLIKIYGYLWIQFLSPLMTR